MCSWSGRFLRRGSQTWSSSRGLCFSGIGSWTWSLGSWRLSRCHRFRFGCNWWFDAIWSSIGLDLGLVPADDLEALAPAADLQVVTADWVEDLDLTGHVLYYYSSSLVRLWAISRISSIANRCYQRKELSSSSALCSVCFLGIQLRNQSKKYCRRTALLHSL